jgi:GNAT superfamily N-acetyltransferase
VLGFFSREKISWEDYNLACILIFPPYQRHGLGQLLIEYSYYLTRYAGKTGSPEKPLSNHGYASYMRYWATTVARIVCCAAEKSSKLSIRQISFKSGIDSREVIQALEHMGALESGTLTSGGAVYSISIPAIVSWIEKAHANLKPYLNENYCIH